MYNHSSVPPCSSSNPLRYPVAIKNDCAVAQCAAKQTIGLVILSAASTSFVPSQYCEREIGEVVEQVLSIY
jgi:hypothetical protein